MRTATPIVSMEGLTRVIDVSRLWLNWVIEWLPKRMLTAVSDVSFEIPERTIYALAGKSSSAKSTIGKMVVGLPRPTEGQVEIKGLDLFAKPDSDVIRCIRSDIQMIFQNPFASLDPRCRVRDIIAEPVAARGGDVTGLLDRLLEQGGLSS